ncbi:hypothetical protein Goshw_006068 [Gossypium schwendimanii]|uniref:Uncharacterized protein n=1 Tax=Gossypium schwendimanii TaxID=34291 RepID=A0A7J9L1E3_GOSSC|nr:hypothetical protein [Gossypium schwendimanii]
MFFLYGCCREMAVGTCRQELAWVILKLKGKSLLVAKLKCLECIFVCDMETEEQEIFWCIFLN